MALSIYTKACAKNIAGNNAVFVTEASNIDNVTVDASGEVTGITMVSSATFKQLQADQDSIARLEEAAGNDSNLSYTHSVQLGFAKGSVNLNTLRDSLAAASPCGIVAIVQDANGNCWLVGYNEVDKTKRSLRLVTDSYTSGNSPADEDVQKADVILESVSGYADLPLNSTLNAAVTAALAAGGGTAIELSFATNMLANGTFDSDTIWEKTTAWSIGGGVASYDGLVTSSHLKQTDGNMLSSIAGSTDYKITFTISNCAGVAQLIFTSYSGTVAYIAQADYAPGTHEVTFTTPASVAGGGLIIGAYNSTGVAFDLDDVILNIN